MGDTFNEGYPWDGETPVHEVHLSAFVIDATPVTNEQFARFIEATGYQTDAERLGTSAVFHLALAAEPTDVLGRSPGAPWWLEVRGADWAHPGGRHSGVADIPKHPVVHVSYFDALAYCAWSGRALPTEAQFECAARGGMSGRRYPWGDELRPAGAHMANIWQGEFPRYNSGEDGYLTTSPVRAFQPNAYGIYDSSGNVWEWCADWYSAGYYAASLPGDPRGPANGDTRVLRGGSYLCHHSYCNRYRVAARTSNTPDSTSGNCGFRTVKHT
jgi:formylglycine-generating enzyme required for sulfatase activity